MTEALLDKTRLDARMISKPPLSTLPAIGAALLAFCGQVVAADSPQFERDILPVFYHHCFACHSGKQAKPKGNLRLDSAEAMRRSDVIVAGKPDDSELLKRVSLPHSDEEVMPPLKGGAQPLNDAERAMLRQWIADGAKMDSWVKFDHRGAALPTTDASPAQADVRQLSGELQTLVDRSHAAKGTKPNAPVNDETFLRRVYLDVVGRIPGLEESERFLGSKDADKRAKLINELLNSEGYVSHMFNWKADLLRLNTRGLAAGQPGKLYDDWVSSTIAPLKRLTTDTGMLLKYPGTYPYDAALRGKPVEPRTLFGDEAVITDGNRRKAFAEWLTSPRNPRFAKNIANRLWKRVMGVGLIEPVDSLSALPNPEHAELMDYLTQTMIRLRFDERAFLAVLLNTRLYQSEAVRGTPEPATAFALRGPQLRRLSAEQIWDSHLVLLAKDMDERKTTFRLEGVLDPQRLRKLTTMTADEIIAQARIDRAGHTRRRELSLRRAEQAKAVAAAKARGDAKEVKRLTAVHAKQNKEVAGSDMKAMDSEADGESATKETDPRWKSLPPTFIRASETPLPLPLGHFLRQFGQSDRREIDAFNRDPNTTHSLALMNGELTTRALADDSYLRRQLAAGNTVGDQRTQLIYRAILIRPASAEELAEMAAMTKGSPTPEQDIIWALLNSPEFLFNQ